jgi:signal transduction histidine kinase
MDTERDISQSLISENDILRYLVTIFPDSIILKENFEIIAVAESVCAELGYKQHELINKWIQNLFPDTTTIQLLDRKLSRGFFDNFIISLIDKNGGPVRFSISGFYLGLISDTNGIILKVKTLDQAVVASKQLEASRNELDEFVYRTTHDLRGPLATMRGLINLIKLETGSLSQDMKQLVGLLDSHAQTLDDRLFNLNYLSETSHVKGADYNLDCEELESTLRSTLEQSLSVNNIDFQFSSTQRYINGVNAQLTISMLNHLLLYLNHLPKSARAKVSYNIESYDRGMRITIHSEGFLSNYQLRQAIQHEHPIYTNIIMYSDLINFFAALKIARRTGASINVDYIHEMSQQMVVTVAGE